MRLHSDKLTVADFHEAAQAARAYFAEYDGLTVHNSRIRKRGFNVLLRGESKRRPNTGGYTDEYTATWDQWGVFFAYLFAKDPKMLAGSGPKYAVYKDAADFHWQTDDRFADRSDEVAYATEPVYWPADAHGDHTFRNPGVPYTQTCTKCSATFYWEPRTHREAA